MSEQRENGYFLHHISVLLLLLQDVSSKFLLELSKLPPSLNLHLIQIIENRNITRTLITN